MERTVITIAIPRGPGSTVFEKLTEQDIGTAWVEIEDLAEGDGGMPLIYSGEVEILTVERKEVA